MARTPQDRAAEWLLHEIDGRAIEHRTESKFKQAGRQVDREPRAVSQGLALLQKRGHVETDPDWKRARLPAKAFRLTAAGRAVLEQRVKDQAAREVEMFRSAEG